MLYKTGKGIVSFKTTTGDCKTGSSSIKLGNSLQRKRGKTVVLRKQLDYWFMFNGVSCEVSGLKVTNRPMRQAYPGK